MARRPDGSYEFGNMDMANPEYQQRNATANAAIRSGSSNPYPGYESVGVTGPKKSSFGASSTAASSSLMGSQAQRSGGQQSPLAQLILWPIIGLEGYAFYKFGWTGVWTLTGFTVGILFLWQVMRLVGRRS